MTAPQPSNDIDILRSNLAEALRFFGQATGTGEVRQLDAALAIYSGLDYGVFNIAVMTDPGPVSGEALERCVEESAGFFAAPRSTRWSFWLCRDSLDTVRRFAPRLGPFSRRNMRQISTAPGMVAESLTAPVRELPQLECRPVDSSRLREDFGGVAAACFDLPVHVVRDVYYPERGWRGSYRGYLGYVEGRPVSIAAVVPAAGVLGIYSLATMPGDRRLGYGEALLRYAIHAEQARTGIQRMVLQSTPAGHRIYRRLGFREVTQFAVYLAG